jgi:hypothetical protein
MAVIGTPPGTGPQLVDGIWLAAVAATQNETFTSGISAAGTTQATSTPIPSAFALVEIDTVPGSSGVSLPFAFTGVEIQLINSTSTTVIVYPSIANNPITGIQDTVNGATSVSVTGVSGGTVSALVCAKNGKWFLK